MQTTATAWLALDSAGGAFAVGLVLAARMLPNLLFGLAAGTLADRANRRHILAGVGLAALPVMLALNRLASQPAIAVWQLVTLSFLLGCVPVFDVPSRQALVMDTVPRELAPNAMALNATAGRLCTALGALIAGAVISLLDVASVYLCVALVYLTGAVLVMFVRPAATHAHVGVRSSFSQALAEAVHMLVDIPAVRTLIAAGVACEIFGFSFTTAVPSFARDVLGAGAEGLGTLNAAASVGGTLSVVVLSLLPATVRREPVLGGVFVVYGTALLGLALCRELAPAAGVLLIIGACAAAFDLLQQTLVQLAVPEAQRGRAVGIWVLGLGTGPIGHIEMGTLAATLGTPVGLAINGCFVLAGAGMLLIKAPEYRGRADTQRAAELAGRP